MNEPLRKDISEEELAVRLANYVLDTSPDPDADIAILARQFLRKRETIRSIVEAAGGHIFVPSRCIASGNDPNKTLVVSLNDEEHGYDVLLRHI